MFAGGWRQWFGLKAGLGQNLQSKRRRRGGPAAHPAEILETRVLLSATHLVFKEQPMNGTAGQTLSVQVSVENSSGTVLTDNNTSTVRLTIRGPGPFAGQGRSVTATVAEGVATFSGLTLDKAGSYTLVASIGHRHFTDSQSFTISPDTTGTEQLAFLRSDPRQGVVNDALRTVKVAVEDQYGNILTSDTSSVTLTVNSGPTTTFANNVPSYTEPTSQGVADFTDVTLDTEGTYTFQATDGSMTAVSGNVRIHEQGQGWGGDYGGHDWGGRDYGGDSFGYGRGF